MDFKTLGTVPLQPSEAIMPSGGMVPPDQTGMADQTGGIPDPGVGDMPGVTGEPGLDQMPSANPGIPGDGSGMATPEQIAELHQLLDIIEQKHQELGTDRIINKNEMDASTQETLGEIFQILQDAGVDLNDQNSINEFLTSLEKSNPDMYEIFAEILDSLLDPETPDEKQELDLSEVPSEEESALIESANQTPPTDLGQVPPMDLSQVPSQ